MFDERDTTTDRVAALIAETLDEIIKVNRVLSRGSRLLSQALKHGPVTARCSARVGAGL
jgi:hypothetical protein